MKFVESIDQIHLSFAEPWAQNAPAWVLFGCVLLMVASIWFYRNYQSGPRPKARLTLAVVRGLLLAVLLVILADPVLRFLSWFSDSPPLLHGGRGILLALAFGGLIAARDAERRHS